MVKIIELIYSDDATVGVGTDSDPVRTLYRLYRKDGMVVGYQDRYTGDSYLDISTLLEK